MGRITLNVLLSFVQFEREVIGERIRDNSRHRRRRAFSSTGFSNSPKPEPGDWFGWLGKPKEGFGEPVGLPEIGCFMSFRLWLFDCIHGPEPPTLADPQCEADRR